MSELAEEIVAEWLNRDRYFTIRGRRDGNTELDLLAMRLGAAGPECWHWEVQVSLRPVGYISKWSREDQRALNVPPGSAKTRSADELARCVRRWVDGKYRSAAVARVREALAPGARWREGFIHGRVKDESELQLIASHGIELKKFSDVLASIVGVAKRREGAGGGKLTELLSFLTESNALGSAPLSKEKFGAPRSARLTIGTSRLLKR